MVWHKTEKYPESYACKWKSLLSNFDSSLWKLSFSNFSWISPLSPLFNMDTSLWQAVKVVLDLDVPNFIKSLPLQWTHLWFWQLALLLPFPYYGVFTLVCVQSNYRINSTSGGHLIKVSKWEGADRKKSIRFKHVLHATQQVSEAAQTYSSHKLFVHSPRRNSLFDKLRGKSSDYVINCLVESWDLSCESQ